MARLVPLLCLCLVAPPAHAEGSFPLFALPDHPAVVGEGGASVPVATGAVAVSLNPAGTAQGGAELSLSIGFLAQDIRVHAGAIAVPLPRSRRLVWGGISLASVSYPSMEGRTSPSSLPLGHYGASETRLAASIAWGLPRDASVGLALTLAEARVQDATASTVALGAGALWRLTGRFELGVCGINLMTLRTDDALGDATCSLHAGVRWRPPRTPLALAGGLRWLDDDLQACGGLQYEVTDELSLRVGRVFGHDTAGFSAGMTTTVGDVGLSYSFEEHRLDFGASHRVGLTWRL